MRKADNLPQPCAVGTKSGSLNFLEPSGSLRACNGTALPHQKYYPAFTKVSTGKEIGATEEEKCGQVVSGNT